jgi:pyruvate dehydrogenase E1 component alpha subunit
MPAIKTQKKAPEKEAPVYSSALQIQLYTAMLRIRLFEEKIVALYPEQEMKCPVHLCIGQEAIAAGICANLEKRDYVFSNHRGHGHSLAKGAGMKPLMAEFYGKATGCSKGKGGSMHIVDVPNGLLGTSAIVGGGIPMAVGSALASKIKGEQSITAVFFGDGAFEEGAFYESFNISARKRLPVIFVCENNFYATNSHQRARQFACKISSSAIAFDAPGVCIDGNDVLSAYKAGKDAAQRARNNGGPTLIEATTYRWKGHVGPDTDHEKGCRPKDELLEWIKKCPIGRFEKHLLETGILDANALIAITEEIGIEVDDAVKFAKESPYPDVSELLTQVYSD